MLNIYYFSYSILCLDFRKIEISARASKKIGCKKSIFCFNMLTQAVKLDKTDIDYRDLNACSLLTKQMPYLNKLPLDFEVL